jgi:uracil phosphoribosyltransferase
MVVVADSMVAVADSMVAVADSMVAVADSMVAAGIARTSNMHSIEAPFSANHLFRAVG